MLLIEPNLVDFDQDIVAPKLHILFVALLTLAPKIKLLT